MEFELVFTDQLENLRHVKTALEEKRAELLDGIALIVLASINDTFEEQGRPEWVENAPSTKAAKAGDMVLHESGMLKASQTFEVDEANDMVLIGISGPASVYGPIQNFGGETGRGGATVIPERRFSQVHDEDHDSISRFSRGFLFNAG